MPELPDLEAVRAFLQPRLAGVPIQQVEVYIGVVLRAIKDEFVAALTGNACRDISRRGKYLLFHLESGHVLAVHAMLSGRFQYCPSEAQRHRKTCFRLALASGYDLRYHDERLMGRVYLVPEEGVQGLPRLATLGPEPFAADFRADAFAKGIARHKGHVKDALTGERLAAGIGNAYADEILFAAAIRPSRRTASLTPEEVQRLYQAIPQVLAEAVATLQAREGDEIDHERRDFLKVHRRGGQPCPTCGQPLTERVSSGRVTTFCARCQH